MPGFMSLPPEIRIQIYDLCISPHHKQLGIHSGVTPRDIVSCLMTRPIFRLSARIRHEALTRMFQSKIWEFYSLPAMLAFLHLAGVYADLITDVLIHTTTRIPDEAMANQVRERLASLKGLKAVSLIQTTRPRYYHGPSPRIKNPSWAASTRLTEKAEAQGVQVKLLNGYIWMNDRPRPGLII